MKFKTCCGIIGAASLLASQSLFAAYSYIGSGSLDITAPGFSADGDQAGPYQVSMQVTSGPTPISSTSFETFCLGTEVDYYPPASYSYQISETVQPMYNDNGNVPGVGLNYVAWGTAWLYSQFRAGTFGPNNSYDTETLDILQLAIWSLQGQPAGGIQLSPVAEGDINLSADVQNLLDEVALAATANHVTSDENNADGAFGVYALNMLSGSTYMQPQLVMLPVPEPTTWMAGGLMLLPFGASVLRIARKRVAA
jgi:hypothetical protein